MPSTGAATMQPRCISAIRRGHFASIRNILFDRKQGEKIYRRMKAVDIKGRPLILWKFF